MPPDLDRNKVPHWRIAEKVLTAGQATYLAFFFSFFSLRFSFRLFVGSFFLSFFVTSPFVMALNLWFTINYKSSAINANKDVKIADTN